MGKHKLDAEYITVSAFADEACFIFNLKCIPWFDVGTTEILGAISADARP
jgi:hypothetical protein